MGQNAGTAATSPRRALLDAGDIVWRSRIGARRARRVARRAAPAPPAAPADKGRWQPIDRDDGKISRSARRIAIVVGLVYYVAALIVFRDVLTAIPDVLTGKSVIVGDELVPFFNWHDQFLDQAAGQFNELVNGYEFRVRYAFFTSWFRYYKVLPFAIVFIVPSIYFAVYLTVARFMDKVFTTLSSQAIYLGTAFPVALIYMIMTYSKITHFYTLMLGLGLMTIAGLWMLYALLFARVKWRRYAVLGSVATLFNPAIHYLILTSLFYGISMFTLLLGEIARWIRRGGPARLRKAPRIIRKLVRKPARRRKLRYVWHATFDTTIGRCVGAGLIYLGVTLIPYALFVKYVALRGIPNLSETVPGDYYFIRDASVNWVHLLAWDLAGITDKVLYGDYLAKIPRYPNVAYTVLLLVPLVIPLFTRALFVTRRHRQLLGVLLVTIAFSSWATIGYGQPLWFPTFHRALAALARGADSTNTPIGDLILKLAATIVQVLRFPHRFQLILFMLAPMVMGLALAFAIDAIPKLIMLRIRRPKPVRADPDRPAPRDQAGEAANLLLIRVLATICVASVFFTPFWSNSAYRKAFSSGNFAGFLAPYPLHDLRQLKDALNKLPEGKTVVIPPTETAKLVTDSNGVDHRFIDKFFIYYLDKPSYYYGLTGDIKNKFNFFLILRGMYYQQDWWINIARNIDIRYIVVNRKLRDNRGVGAEYLPKVEDYVEPDIKRLNKYLKLRFENDTYALYELVDQPKPQRPVLLVDSSWSSYLNLVYTRLDLSSCYDLQFLSYFDAKSVKPTDPINLVTDDTHSSAVDLYLLDHPDLISPPDTKIFAFNSDVVAASYYLSPMFREFLFFSNTKWNRTGMITPGVFGTLRGSFIGLPRATRVTVPVDIPADGKYRLLMRTAATANALHIVGRQAGYDKTVELRSPQKDLGLFKVAEVYDADRKPVDTSKMSVADIEKAIPDTLLPVNLNFSYQDLGTITAKKGTINFQLTKTDTNPMLLEGMMLIPESDYAHLTTNPNVTVVTDPRKLNCSQTTPAPRPDQLVPKDAAAHAAHPELSDEELADLAAAGVEDMVPDPTGGVGPSWLALASTGVLLVLSGVVVRWRIRTRHEDEGDPAEAPAEPPPDPADPTPSDPTDPSPPESQAEETDR